MNMTPDKAAKPSVFYKRAFLVLLAVNLLVAGGILGAMWRHGGGHHGRGGGLPGFVRTLDSDRKDVIRSAFENRRETMRPLRDDVRAKRDALNAALEAKPFDQASVTSALQDARQARDTLRDAREAMFINALALMTDGEREAFADWRKRRKGRHRGERYGSDDRDDN